MKNKYQIKRARGLIIQNERNVIDTIDRNHVEIDLFRSLISLSFYVRLLHWNFQSYSNIFDV